MAVAYAATNLLLALIVFLKAKRSLVVRFYLFLVVSLVVFGACGYLYSFPLTNVQAAVIGAAGSFLFALFPFFFLHFMIIMVRREELLQSPFTVGLIYFAGLFSYTFELIGLIPKPVAHGVGLSPVGYVFLVTWMSVAFSIGVAILFTFVKGFSDRGMKSNLLVAGFALLLLLLPGPFTESIFFAFFPKSMELYLVSSLMSLVIALYFVFRHKIIVNTLYDSIKSALTFMSDVLFRLDDGMNIQFARGGGLASLGYKENELTGRSIYELTNHGEVIKSYRERALEGNEEDIVVDVDFVSKEGGPVQMNLSMTVVVETGQIVGFVGIGRDNTERKRSELLQAALYRLAEITRVTESLKDFCKSIHEVISQVVPARDFYIAMRDDISHKLVYPYYENHVYPIPQTHPGLDGFNEQVMMSGSPSVLTTNDPSDLDERGQTGVRLSNPIDWVGIPLKTASGTIGVLGVENYSESHRLGEREKNLLSLLSGQIATSVERKKTEEKIREQAALLDKSQDAIILETLDGVITFWNQGASRIYGWEPDEVTGKTFANLYGGTLSEGTKNADQAVRSGGEWSGEVETTNRSGESIVLDCRWKLVTDIDGRPRAIMKVCTDITERKKLEAQFMRAQRLESIGTLAGGIAHDLNNVLSPIMMSVRTLKRRLDDEPSGKILEAIESSAKRGADMVRQVLMFGRGAKGERLILQPRHLIREIMNIATETFPKSIKVEHVIPRDLWTVLGDATQLHQVLLNLCVNARDAMQEGGILTLSAENLLIDKDYARVHVDSKPGKYVLITVSDTGEGIPQGILDKIFEPFFTTKDVGKGTGLGLSTALALVKAHGGFMTVYSEVNRGTSFRVYLPASEVSEASQPVEIDLEQYVGHGEMILVVDDESSIREIARATLEAYGYRVIVAKDGAEAIAVFVKNMDYVKSILIDNMMPVLDGRSAIAALRRMETDVRIIATSGLQDEIPKDFANQIDAFLNKPFTGEKLLKTVHDVMYRERK